MQALQSKRRRRFAFAGALQIYGPRKCKMQALPRCSRSNPKRRRRFALPPRSKFKTAQMQDAGVPQDSH